MQGNYKYEKCDMILICQFCYFGLLYIYIYIQILALVADHTDADIISLEGLDHLNLLAKLFNKTFRKVLQFSLHYTKQLLSRRPVDQIEFHAQ